MFQAEVFDRTPNCFNLWSMGIAVFFSLVTVILAWILLVIQIYRILKIQADQPDPRKEEEYKKYWGEKQGPFHKAAKIAIPVDIAMLVCFLVSFAAFIMHLISYVV